MSVASEIQRVSRPLDDQAIRRQVQAHIDDTFSDLDVLTGHAGPSQPSTSPARRGAKRRRNLTDEIAYWENKVQAANTELEQTSSTLPALLQTTQERLGSVLRSAQDLSLQRYSLADKLSTLVSELDSSRPTHGEDGPTDRHGVQGEGSGRSARGQTVLEQMEEMQAELSRLQAGLAWVTVLEQVLVLSEKTLDSRGHHPSALAALSHFTALHDVVEKVIQTLPAGMALVRVTVDLREKTWQGLKDIMSKTLLDSLEALRWPVKVHYADVPAPRRRAFERAYQDLLYLQAEGEALGVERQAQGKWYDGIGLYPLQAMVQPIALRFKYHFQGSRNTNRVDKPEWAFTSVLDRIYEHTPFIEEVLVPLTRKAGFGQVDVKSEFVMLLFPMVLGLLRSRIPHLLDTPALLAHTIYQTVIFDDAVREHGFDIDNVSINEGVENGPWDGLAGVVLREEGWFDKWLAGEKTFAEKQLYEIMSSSDAWNISDESSSEDQEDLMKPTTSARQVKALIEQVTDRYSPLPSLPHRLPFLLSIQLPLLATYLSRVSGSLDAFETLSSAFVRVVPGALSGNTRSGAHIDQTKLTTGKAGLERLIKASLSAGYVLAALRSWSDDVFFVEMSNDVKTDASVRSMVQTDLLVPATIRTGQITADSMFDTIMERYATVVRRTEDMIVRHVSAEVEADLKQHLTRRWDRTDGEGVPDSSLLQALTTYSSHLATLSPLLPPLSTSRVYRGIASHLTNHIAHRAVYAGWSKFTPLGGKDFADEIKDWVSSSLGVDLLGGEAAVRAPWVPLEDAGKMLSLPIDEDQDEQGRQGQPTFGQAMAVAWADGDETLRMWQERTGVRMDRQALREVLKRRRECWM